jgi:hypothetical protein
MPTGSPVREIDIRLGGHSTRQVGVARQSRDLWTPAAQSAGYATSPFVYGTVGDVAWPDAFMSYPAGPSNGIVLNGASNVTIEYLSFDGTATRASGNPRPITLLGCNNITIRRIDSRKCTMGLLFALNCTDITVEYCRAENIAWELREQYLIPQSAKDNHPEIWYEDWPVFGNSNDCNMYQMDSCSGIRTSHVKVRYGNTEDVFSHYKSDDVICTDLQVEGAVSTTQPTSDGSPSVPWTSASGTGAILGDEGGHDILIQDSSFLNSGQVGMQIAGGYNCVFDNCESYNEGYTLQWWNQPMTTWNGTPPMTGHGFTYCRTWGHADANRETVPHIGFNWVEAHGWFDDSAPLPDTTGTVQGDATLNREDMRVVL